MILLEQSAAVLTCWLNLFQKWGPASRWDLFNTISIILPTFDLISTHMDSTPFNWISVRGIILIWSRKNNIIPPPWLFLSNRYGLQLKPCKNMCSSMTEWSKCVSVKQTISKSSTNRAISLILFLKLLTLRCRILIEDWSEWVCYPRTGPGFSYISPHSNSKHCLIIYVNSILI